MTEEQAQELIELLTSIKDQKTAISYEWRVVIRELRNYARMKTFGCYEEGGQIIKVNHSDKERYLSLFLDNASHRSIDALQAELQGVD